MADNKKTQFDRLTSIFQDDIVNPQQLGNNIDGNKNIIKASSPSDLEVLKRETQQQIYINKQFGHMSEYDDKQIVSANALRMPAYFEFNVMEGYPILARALDLLSEEATTIGENGKMLNIFSKFIL